MSDHEMRMAKLSPATAKRLGLSSNHHARVWCCCMDQPEHPPGAFAVRLLDEVLHDPRRLGAWDALGVVDLRITDSALVLYRQHLEESAA